MWRMKEIDGQDQLEWNGMDRMRWHRKGETEGFWKKECRSKRGGTEHRLHSDLKLRERPNSNRTEGHRTRLTLWTLKKLIIFWPRNSFKLQAPTLTLCRRSQPTTNRHCHSHSLSAQRINQNTKNQTKQKTPHSATISLQHTPSLIDRFSLFHRILME